MPTLRVGRDGHPRGSGVDCTTVYFVNERTRTLAFFATRSSRFETPLGTRPGMPWPRVRERGRTYVNCEGLFVLGRNARLVVENIGGTESRDDLHGRIVGGSVLELEPESTAHPLSLECPGW